jgi:hypothetical protein
MEINITHVRIVLSRRRAITGVMRDVTENEFGFVVFLWLSQRYIKPTLNSGRLTAGVSYSGATPRGHPGQYLPAVPHGEHLRT